MTLGLVAHLISFQNIDFTSYYYGCGVRFLTGYTRILIPDKEWDILGHILVPKKKSERDNYTLHPPPVLDLTQQKPSLLQFPVLFGTKLQSKRKKTKCC